MMNKTTPSRVKHAYRWTFEVFITFKCYGRWVPYIRILKERGIFKPGFPERR